MSIEVWPCSMKCASNVGSLALQSKLPYRIHQTFQIAGRVDANYPLLKLRRTHRIEDDALRSSFAEAPASALCRHRARAAANKAFAR